MARACESYDKAFKKTDPVQLHLESLALNGKSIPRVDSLVEAMVVAELKNHISTGGA